jgi:YD repeat-containing protein
MLGRLKIVGAIVAVIGLIGVIGGIFGYTQVQAGANALQGFSKAQNVTLTYDDQGQLVDRGDPEQGKVILALLKDTWGWPVNQGDLNPNDPVVNTGTEYMYQMATIAHHTLDGTTSVTLAEPVAYDGDGDGTVAADAPSYTPETLPQDQAYLETLRSDANFAAGTYTVPTLERYWTAFNRTHPLDGQARDLAWSGTVHGLFAELGVGATSFSALQMGQALAMIAVAFGILFIITGLGLVWVGMAKPEAAAGA